MYTVSADTLAALQSGGKVAYKATITTPDGSVTALNLSACTVTGQSGNVRRTASITVVAGSRQEVTELYNLLSTETAIFDVLAGFDFGTDTISWTPMVHGRATKVAESTGDVKVTVDVSDFGLDLAAVTLSPAIVQPASMTRRDAITAIITTAIPGVQIRDDSTGTGTLGSEQTWSGTAWDAINSIATDAVAEVFFDPSGVCVIRDKPMLGTPVSLFTTGQGGTITGLNRERPLDSLYNVVQATAAATDGSQGWSTAEVSIDAIDPSSPRSPSLIGRRVKAIDSVTASSAAEASRVCVQALRAVMGSTETLSMSAVLNWAIEIGDTVQVVAAKYGDSDTVTLTHIVDGFSFDLFGMTMTLSTRNQGADDA